MYSKLLQTFLERYGELPADNPINKEFKEYRINRYLYVIVDSDEIEEENIDFSSSQINATVDLKDDVSYFLLEFYLEEIYSCRY